MMALALLSRLDETADRQREPTGKGEIDVISSDLGHNMQGADERDRRKDQGYDEYPSRRRMHDLSSQKMSPEGKKTLASAPIPLIDSAGRFHWRAAGREDLEVVNALPSLPGFMQIWALSQEFLNGVLGT